jgi:lysozyme family protein
MQANYTPFIARVIQRYEGGYGWDKSDPGGPTKYGITCYDLAEHRGKVMNSMSSWAPLVQAMTLSEAEDIYAAKYATGLYFNELHSGPDCAVLDYGINSGIARPLLVAKRLLNFTGTNPALITAINAAHVADPKWFVDALCQERLAFMHQIRGGSAWAEFGKGWGARVADVDAYSDNLAASLATASPGPVAPTIPHPKVTHGDPNISTSVATKTAVTTAGSAAAAHAAGPPSWVLPALIGSLVVGSVAFVLYEQYKTTQANLAVTIPPSVPPMPAAVKIAVIASSAASAASATGATGASHA